MTEAIQARYSGLAQSECCLSCGGAVQRAEPKPGEVCLDLGSGRGNDVLRLAEKVGATGHVYGVDVADGMIEKARKTADKLGVTNVDFLKATFDHLPLPDGSIDWIVSNCSLNHADNKPAVWREIARVLRPGGRFVVSDIYALTPIPDEHRNDPEAVAECWAGAVVKHEYLAEIAGAGLERVEILEESQPYAKGKTTVASFTLSGEKPKSRCCCSCA
ncbi:methyltransferase domain-containing protein [Myxococcota bacterium]|nr:methyltransferase domain-containing protein [Myxococcota bacterium]